MLTYICAKYLSSITNHVRVAFKRTCVLLGHFLARLDNNFSSVLESVDLLSRFTIPNFPLIVSVMSNDFLMHHKSSVHVRKGVRHTCTYFSLECFNIEPWKKNKCGNHTCKLQKYKRYHFEIS